jgi:hypothetical protein
MKRAIWLLVALLIIVHQDFWYWDREQIVLGFMPIGLFYHVCLSMAAAFVWILACTFAWPEGIDDFDDEPAPRKGGKA